MMPTRPVRKGGKVIGYRWGKSGKLYKGKGAKEKADRQGKAVSISKARKAGHKIPFKNEVRSSQFPVISFTILKNKSKKD